MKNPPTNQKSKQFSASTKKAHNRSASIGRNLNKLGRIASSEDVTQRPNLKRSKSSDGVSARRNRSFTKLTSLQPLHRTTSHQQVTRQHSYEKVAMDLHSDEENDVQEEEVDNFSDENNEPDNKQMETVAPLSYKAPPQFGQSYIKPDSSFAEDSQAHHIEQTEAIESAPNVENTHKKSLIDSEKLSQITQELSLNDTNETELPPGTAAALPPTTHAKEPSKEELGQYYQNMILSQSTGLVRNFNDQPFQNSLLPENLQNIKHVDHIPYIHSNDHISGALSSLRQTGYSSNSLRQFTINNTVVKMPSSHESGISFKAEPGLNMTSISKINSKESVSGTPNNFSNFLRSNNANIETRTQQKLWLQRENSLLDITSVNNSNNQANNPQIRREFERVSREYLNNRRFENPLLDSVKRVNLEKITKSTTPSIKEPVIFTVKSIMNESTQKKLLKLWVQGEKPVNRPGYVNYQPSNLQQYHQNQRMYHVQQQHHQRPIMNNSYLSGNRLQSTTAPSTRAVDRANDSPQTKRIDLATIRLQEAEQVQKLS